MRMNKILSLITYYLLTKFAYACGYAKRYPLGIPLGQRDKELARM